MSAIHKPAPPPKPENIWLNLLCNLALPALVLSKLSPENRLGPVGALVVGLSIPLGYGIYDLVRRKKWNLFSIVGLVSVALSGGLGLAKASPLTFAFKEAAIPTMFAVAVIATLETRKPLVREMLFNESIIDVPKVEAALAERGTRAQFDRLLVTSTWWLAASFVLSAALNFGLARVVLRSPAGTPEFTAELGKMTWLSWPVIMVPGMVMMIFILLRLFRGVHRLTGLEIESVMHGKHTEPAPVGLDAPK
jgi:hypothetical protein